MKKLIRRHWVILAGTLLLIVAVVLSVKLPTQIQNFDARLQAVVVSTGYALFFVQYLYSRSERFYVQVSTWRLWLTNASTKWNFVVDLQGCARARPLHSAWGVISQQVQQATRWHSDDSSLIANMPGYSLRVFVTQETSPLDDGTADTRVVCIQVSNLELPFRIFRAKIENEIIPLIEQIAETLEPAVEKYAAKIRFSSTNPYFGFFIRRLDLPKVVSFTCDLIESSVGGRDQTVTVRKDQIEIVTDSPLALQTLSLKYVALAGH